MFKKPYYGLVSTAYCVTDEIFTERQDEKWNKWERKTSVINVFTNL